MCPRESYSVFDRNRVSTCAILYPVETQSKSHARAHKHRRGSCFLGGRRMSKEEFLWHLKAYRNKLPRHVVLTLRGQALSGDIEGARRGLAHILQRSA